VGSLGGEDGRRWIGDEARLGDPYPLDLGVRRLGIEMNGLAVIDRARAYQPGLKMLLITGYAEALRNNGVFGIPVLPKPFKVAVGLDLWLMPPISPVGNRSPKPTMSDLVARISWAGGLGRVA
jgi:hypothetical protein